MEELICLTEVVRTELGAASLAEGETRDLAAGLPLGLVDSHPVSTQNCTALSPELLGAEEAGCCFTTPTPPPGFEREWPENPGTNEDALVSPRDGHADRGDVGDLMMLLLLPELRRAGDPGLIAALAAGFKRGDPLLLLLPNGDASRGAPAAVRNGDGDDLGDALVAVAAAGLALPPDPALKFATPPTRDARVAEGDRVGVVADLSLFPLSLRLSAAEGVTTEDILSPTAPPPRPPTHPCAAPAHRDDPDEVCIMMR